MPRLWPQVATKLLALYDGMIGNSHDPATPLAYSRAAARQSGSHLITYQGWGHTAYYPT